MENRPILMEEGDLNTHNTPKYSLTCTPKSVFKNVTYIYL